MSAARFLTNSAPCRRTRREFLWQWGGGFAAIPLIDLLLSENRPLQAAATHFPTPVKQVVFFFLNGGPSQVDTFDHKPALKK